MGIGPSPKSEPLDPCMIYSPIDSLEFYDKLGITVSLPSCKCITTNSVDFKTPDTLQKQMSTEKTWLFRVYRGLYYPVIYRYIYIYIHGDYKEPS